MPVTFRLARSRDVAQRGLVVDLSLRGMRLLSPVKVPVGERISINCAFCSAVALVKSGSPTGAYRQGGWLCGVEFLTLHIRREQGGLISTRV